MSDLWMTLSTAFDTPEHRPLFLAGGDRAALLVHGFLGTPAEWRPLADILAHRGWTVSAPLLPGFGARLSELPTVTVEAWIAELTRAFEALAPLPHRVVVGFSLGGALATILAATVRPAALVLLAPFSRLPLPWWYRAMLPVASRILPGPRPFARVNFDDPAVRHALVGWNPALDVDDPSLREHLRTFRFPWRLLTELSRTADAMRRAARELACPVTIVHGRDDRTVPLRDSRLLLRRIPTLHFYVEVPGDHQLVRPDHPGFLLLVRLFDMLGGGETSP